MAPYLGIKAYLAKRRITREIIVCLLIIELTSMIVCIHWQSTLQPWPLPDALELQDSIEMQLMKSLGILLASLASQVCKLILSINTQHRVLDVLIQNLNSGWDRSISKFEPKPTQRSLAQGS